MTNALAVVAALIVTVLLFGGLALAGYTPGVVHWRLWPTFGFSLLAFAIGFYWQYRGMS